MSDKLVATVDLLPTILEAVGAERPAGLAGRSMVPLLGGQKPRWREYVFAEFHSPSPQLYFPQRTIRDARFKLIVNLLQDRANPQPSHPLLRRLPAHVTRSEVAASNDEVRQAYATWEDAPPVELYDLEDDPYEFKNLAGQPAYAEIEKRLVAQLESWRKRTGDPLSVPAKLARLTQEQDEQAEKHKKGKSRSQSDPWRYHEYLYGK